MKIGGQCPLIYWRDSRFSFNVTCEASDLIWTQISEEQKQEIDVLKCQGSMLRRGTYILAGMHVLREATKAGLIEVNPINSPPGDQQYIAYV